MTPGWLYRLPISILLLSSLLGCKTATHARAGPPDCGVEPVRFYDLPVTPGLADSTFEPGYGGIAVKPVSGHDGSLLRGSQVLLYEDSIGSARPRWGEIVQDSPALFRDIPAGAYWLAFSFIGYQPFTTVVTVPVSRVDTLAVVLYRVGLCLQ